MTTDDQYIPEQKESVKLKKMSKGYQWEIKILDIDLDRLEQIDQDLNKRFGEDLYTEEKQEWTT